MEKEIVSNGLKKNHYVIIINLYKGLKYLHINKTTMLDLETTYRIKGFLHL